MNILIGFLICYFGFNALLVIGIIVKEINDGVFRKDFDGEIEKWGILVNFLKLILFGLPLVIAETVIN